MVDQLLNGPNTIDAGGVRLFCVEWRNSGWLPANFLRAFLFALALQPFISLRQQDRKFAALHRKRRISLLANVRTANPLCKRKVDNFPDYIDGFVLIGIRNLID